MFLEYVSITRFQLAPSIKCTSKKNLETHLQTVSWTILMLNLAELLGIQTSALPLSLSRVS